MAGRDGRLKARDADTGRLADLDPAKHRIVGILADAMNAADAAAQEPAGGDLDALLAIARLNRELADERELRRQADVVLTSLRPLLEAVEAVGWQEIAEILRSSDGDEEPSGGAMRLADRYEAIQAALDAVSK